jgi:hypothetical protein
MRSNKELHQSQINYLGKILENVDETENINILSHTIKKHF